MEKTSTGESQYFIIKSKSKLFYFAQMVEERQCYVWPHEKKQ